MKQPVLIIPAITDADEGVSALVIPLTQLALKEIRAFKKIFEAIKEVDEFKLTSFSEIRFFSWLGQFKVSESGDYDALENPMVVKDIADDEFSNTESPLESYEISINDIGFSFTALGKHTGEEFSTPKVSFDEFEKLIAE